MWSGAALAAARFQAGSGQVSLSVPSEIPARSLLVSGVSLRRCMWSEAGAISVHVWLGDGQLDLFDQSSGFT